MAKWVGIKNSGEEDYILQYGPEFFVCPAGQTTPVPELAAGATFGYLHLFEPRKGPMGLMLPPNAELIAFEKQRVLTQTGYPLGEHPTISLVPADKMEKLMTRYAIPADADDDEEDSPSVADTLAGLSVKELKARCDEMGIDYHRKSSRETLSKLIVAYLSQIEAMGGEPDAGASGDTDAEE